MPDLFDKKSPSERLLEYNRWNSGDKKFNSFSEFKDSQFANDWVNFMLDLPNSKERTKTTFYNLVDKENKPNVVIESIKELPVEEKDKEYLLVLGKRESSLDPKAVGKTGTYKGLYQFGPSALDTIGMSEHDYLNDIGNQHLAALKLKYHNLNQLAPYMKYIGKTIDGIIITENGLAAAAHLLGTGGVKQFFEKGIVKKDGLGTPITEYFKLFA